DSHENLRVQGSILAMGVHLIMQGLISDQLIEKIKQTAKETTGEIKDILRTLAAKQYPFAHGDGMVKMAEAVCEKPPDEDSLADILFVADDMAGRLIELRERIMGRLCHHAERIEKVMGMKPLPAPEEADALDELLEKIGVDDTGPVQDEAPSAKGLVGALLMQGVMGVTVLALSGWGVYALLPQDPNAIADEPRPPQVAQQDGRRDEPRRSRPEVFNPPDRPGERDTDPSTPDRSRPKIVPDKPTAEEALQMMESRRRIDQWRAMDVLLSEGHNLTPPQITRLSSATTSIMLEQSGPADKGLALLTKYVPDKGLSDLLKALSGDIRFLDRGVISHLATIDQREAADALARLGRSFSHVSTVEDAFKREPMSKYAEDALLAQLALLDDRDESSKKQLARLLAGVATQKSTGMLEKLAADESSSVRRYAEQAINRLDPKRNDTVAKFLRYSRADPNGGQTRSELSRLSRIVPGEDEDRQAEVCQAVLQWKRVTRRPMDSSILLVLENWGDSTAVPVYMQLLEDEDANRAYVKTTIRLAGEQADERQAKRVADAIGNWFLLEPDAVTQGLIALGEPGEAPAIKNIKSKHGTVRLACIEVLREVGTAKGLGALRSMGKDSDRVVRDAAREAYYEVRHKLKEQNEE
ncbi:MAG: hypothetical protein KTR15_01405, partial [Phycisphaeraceae bacterium]|nr:hypothetical protein [Phycisphaeraceae bacterium]